MSSIQQQPLVPVLLLKEGTTEKAEELINKNVHATIIVDGYRRAAEKAIKILREISTQIDPEDREDLAKIARTTMASKMVSGQSETLANIVMDGILKIVEEYETEENSIGRRSDSTKKSKYRVDLDNIKVEKKAGASAGDSRLIERIALDKEVVHGGMPKRIENARIALLNSPLEVEKPEFDAKLNISNPSQMQRFLDEENKLLKNMVDKIIAAGANVVVCQKGIDDIAQHYLARANLLAVRRVKESDMTKLAKATGARIISNLEDLSSKDLGSADLVWLALMTAKDAIEYPYIVPRGGSPEAIVSQRIREWSNSLDGRAQLAAEQFADSIENIPIVLAENAGTDPIDTLVQLRTKITNNDKPKYGIDVINKKIADLNERNIYEPLAVKEHIVNGATEVASMILRIDDIIAASKSQSPPGPPGGGGGYGGDEYGGDMRVE